MEDLYYSKTKNKEAYDSLLLVEHSSVYTLGKGGSKDNLKFNTSSHKGNVYRVSRGGEVTWHGPGQLVAYPILDLTRHKKDLRWYINKLEECVIRTLDLYGIKGARSEINPGVWVGTKKICAVGVSASRWITIHGLALNINCDLYSYSNIIPCGISPEVGGVTSMAEDKHLVASESRDFFSQVKGSFVDIFKEEFRLEMEEVPISYLDDILRASSDEIQNEILEVVE